jgi:ATP-dependent helicase HrpA
MSMRIEIPDSLPVAARQADIVAAMRAHPVVIVCGETGSGKTTQLPKLAYLAGRGKTGRIGMTEPRRIAARSVAERLAEETQTALGQFVGWQVRFTDQVTEASRIKVMTDGILLAETQRDRRLAQYDTIILDEAHERSLNIDFLLGYLKGLLQRRPDLKLILSSATLEADRFAQWFGGAPVIEVSGRGYPVEMRYRPPAEARDSAEPPDPLQGLLDAVDELAREDAGDILVFLPGEREIREAQEALRKHHPDHTEILPLFSRLSLAEQSRVFQPHAGRRIVLATNVAETSLTVPGIRFVVDTGLARVKRYSLRNRIEQLKVEKIAQAQASQRAGRCGRVAPGICIRLYGEDDFLARAPYPTPELLRSSLAGVMLRMKALRLPDIDAFPFIDPPEAKRVRDGEQSLLELNALDAHGRLTETGKRLARLPVDPRIARMLLAAHENGCLYEVIVIAAFLSVQDPRERPLEKAQAADEKHRRFAHQKSDFITVLNLWRHTQTLLAHHKSRRKLDVLLRQEFIAPQRWREWREVFSQLGLLVKEMGFPVHEPKTDTEGDPFESLYAPLHRALLTGLLGNVGLLTEEGSYLGARDIRFALFPGSGVKARPKWLMAAEIVETRRVYARTVARIEPEWVEAAAQHLLKYSYSEPHWEKKPAQVNALLRATLYGLPVINGRRVHYGGIEPALCRQLFILHALVRGEWESRAPFFRHNQNLLAELDDLAQRTRNARIEVDEAAVTAFFDARVPPEVVNGASFDRWRREAEKAEPKGLFLRREDVFPENQPQLAGYPQTLDWQGRCWPLSYRFDPGAADDGVTLVAPLEAINQIPALRCEWLAPGFLAEKCEALIRSLPQGLRRNFIPVPDFARAATAALKVDDVALTEALAAFLERKTGVRIPRDAWRPEALAAHLAMNFRLLDAKGVVVAEGRDLEALRSAHGHAAQSGLADAGVSLERDGITRWDFDVLPAEVSVHRGRQSLQAYPALQMQSDGSLSLRLFDHRAAADAAQRRGVAWLWWQGQGTRLKQTLKDLAERHKTACLKHGILFAGVGCEGLWRDCLVAALLRLNTHDLAGVRDAGAFAALTWAPVAATQAAQQLGQALADSIALAHELQGRIDKLPATQAAARKELAAQLSGLVFAGFVAAHPPDRLAHLPRYLAAMQRRMERLAREPGRDTLLMQEIKPLMEAMPGLKPEEREILRWRLEELRVSLFAQELKTPEPVSVKRLQKWLGELRG